MSKDNKFCYSPITFINGKPTENNEVNTLFTNPYETRSILNRYHSLAIDDIKERSDLNSEDYKIWAHGIRAVDKDSQYDSLIAYLTTNITDMVIYTIIKFCNEILYFDNNLIGLALDNNIISNIRNSVIEALSMTKMSTCRVEVDQLFVHNDICMDSIYSILVAKVFDNYIVNHIIECYKTEDCMNTLYSLLYSNCYNDIPKKIPNPQETYVFVSSILRESMEVYLTQFRCGLTQLAQNFSIMVDNDSNYALNVLNPDYKTPLLESDEE